MELSLWHAQSSDSKQESNKFISFGSWKYWVNFIKFIRMAYSWKTGKLPFTLFSNQLIHKYFFISHTFNHWKISKIHYYAQMKN